MRSTTKTRVQRRVEKKQVTLLVTLVVVIAIVCFVLGVIVGRHGTESITVENISPAQRIVVADASKLATETQMAAKEPVQEKLTFYDNLSKDDPAPIGSGINLLPDKELTVAEKLAAKNLESGSVESSGKTLVVASAPTKKISEIKSVPAPSKSLPVKVSTEISKKMPVASKGGNWVVQVFSSQSAADAGMLRDSLSGKGYPAFIAEADLGKKGIWYRVLFGPYVEKTIADQVQVKAAKKDKLKGFVRRR